MSTATGQAPELTPLLERVSFALRRRQKVSDLARTESRLEATLRRLFRHQGTLMEIELGKMRGSFLEAPREPEWGPAWERVAGDTERAFTVAVDAAAAEALRKGAQRLSDDLELGVSFDLKNPRAVAWLEAHAGQRVTRISETTRGYIRTLMTHAVDEGWSYDKTARMLKARFTEFAVGVPQQHIASRAHLIAVTESAMGYEAGNALMVADMTAEGLQMEKHWLTVGDSRVDEDCESNEAEGWLPAEASFPDGSDEPPAHPACRCTTQYQVAGQAQEFGQEA